MIRILASHRPPRPPGVNMAIDALEWVRDHLKAARPCVEPPYQQNVVHALVDIETALAELKAAVLPEGVELPPATPAEETKL